MDSLEVSSADTEKKGFPFLLLRFSLAILFPLISFFALSFLFLFTTIFVANSSVSSPISVPSQCKIVSSSVDLRSSKVCELGLFNYKAKHVFYPLERKFRCRYDYYWASVFKVEYKDHSLGQTRLASAEAPDEALPLNCRPNFGAAWLTKDKFKVNKTYDCWYTSGISQVSLYQYGFFNCQAKDPSTIEMVRRYSILYTKILQSWISSMGREKYLRLEMVAGVVTGFLSSLISISFLRLIHQMKLWLLLIRAPRALLQVANTARLKRASFLVVYFCFVGWLAIQYGEKLGLPEIFTVLKS
ncbi:uncharacterized protein LOC121235236 isoform X1 [Juglans microcarpa x Juglans regia]|uniref:uncharacterized protein LOC121235236 isoform X1 n=1 Tax=Juglans microcarpa x Juglans regia TaxID=2249226 RepID=UPI001B7EC8E2|nr:uncharacterized protein LOC121235236 isoform X1 [Juglans microcarpa x Juglans regia]